MGTLEKMKVALTMPLLLPFCFKPVDEAHSMRPPDDPLRVLRNHFPGITGKVRGKRVLDYACGDGWQSAALAELGATVTGLDINNDTLGRARQLHANVEFDHVDAFDADKSRRGKYDFVISQNGMEHFSDPKLVLEIMKRALAPGGVMLITFGPPWYSPQGAHMGYFCKLPWMQLLFPEATVMAIRSKYRSDGAKRYPEVESGLNMMSIRRWEQILREAGLEVVKQRYWAVKKAKILTKLPILRELFIGHVTVVLKAA
jgi:SAM-dependent methyltransferase